MTRAGAALDLGPPAPATLERAWHEATANIGAPDLVVAFASAEWAESAAWLASGLAEQAPDAVVVGAIVGDGVIGGAVEAEDGPALALLAVELPAGATVQPFRVSARRDGDEIRLEGLPEADPGDVALVIADPYTMPADQLAAGLHATGVGGLAGLGAAGAARLLLGGAALPAGAVGAVLRGAGARILVSQGARPLGPELTVTAAEGNALLELAGQPAVERLRSVIGQLPAEEQQLALGGLLLGFVVDENRPDYDLGDFVVRGVLGADEESGALVVGDIPRVGQVVRFHVRDATTADDELRRLVADASPAAAALLFACNGRGTRMFPTADHDAGCLSSALPAPPALAGMFCQGEIGPVAGRGMVHAFTATAILL